MRLFVMRHGIAEDRELWPGPDESRPLTLKGMEKTGWRHDVLPV
jgi:phosphohistidine phosphatase SixA